MIALLDTSFLLKLYYQEADSVALRARLDLEQDTLVVSEPAWVEMHSVFQMKVRQEALTQDEATTRLRPLARDWNSFIHVPLASPVLTRAADLV